MPAGIIFDAVDVTIPRELKPRAIAASVAPRSGHAIGGLGHARQCVNAADRFLVEIHDLLRGFLVGHHGNINGQDVAGVHARLRGLHGDERLEKHAGAGKEHEGGRNLNDRKGAQAAVGAASDSDAATCESGGLRDLGAGEVGNVGEEHCGDYREPRANPEYTRVDGEVQSPNGKAGGERSLRQA